MKNNTKIKFYKILAVLFLLLGVTPFFISANALVLDESLPMGFESLPVDVQSALKQMAANTITDVQAEIKQHIRQPGVDEHRRGYYWADNQGRFRLQFFEPNELVVFDGRQLYWYIPSNGFTWVLGEKQENNLQAPVKPSWLSNEFELMYKPPFAEGWLARDRVEFEVKNKTMRVQVGFSRKTKAVVSRRLIDGAERQLLSEQFGDPVNCGGLPFFLSVHVEAGMGKTKIINDTQYKNPLCNKKISDSLFAAPSGPKKKYQP